jgi:hypothetical protein
MRNEIKEKPKCKKATNDNFSYNSNYDVLMGFMLYNLFFNQPFIYSNLDINVINGIL